MSIAPAVTGIPNGKNLPRVPSYRLHKPSGKAVVTIAGRDVYLGEHGTPESRTRYDRLIGEWLANGRRLPEPGNTGESPSPADDASVAEVLLAYTTHCERKYATRRRFEKLMSRIKSGLRMVRELFGLIPAASFGPKALKACRERWIAGGLSRKTCNELAKGVKACFAWAVSEELCPPSVWHGLSAVANLRAGESTAREPVKVRPVPDADVDAAIPYMRPQIRAMVELQGLTGMRPGEVAIMRTRDIDVTGTVWVYRPAFHKSDLRGHDREVCIGPAAQEVLRPWLRTNLDEHLFQPAEAVAGWRADRAARRVTPLSCGNRAGTNVKRRPKRTPRDVYAVDTYRRAIERASDAADRAARIAVGQPECAACSGRGYVQPDADKPRATTRCKACDGSGRVGERLIQRWHPHQLRHSAATRIRKEFGIEAARILLGHQHVGVTEVYAERDRAVAFQVAEKIG